MAILHLTKDNFKAEVGESAVPVLVDFFATWCGPCGMLGPVLDKVAKELEGTGKAKIGKVNVDEEPELTAHFGVKSIPTMMLFENGKVTQTTIGAKSEEEVWELVGGR